MLLPPDLRDWVAEDDLVHCVLRAVEGLPRSTSHPAQGRRHRAGSAPHDAGSPRPGPRRSGAGRTGTLGEHPARRRAEGKAIYRKGASTVEPVFGVLKSRPGFRQFLRRGLKKGRGEWNPVGGAWNLKRLHGLGADSGLKGRPQRRGAQRTLRQRVECSEHKKRGEQRSVHFFPPDAGWFS